MLHLPPAGLRPLLALLALAAGPASAQAGRYTVAGTNPVGGGTYGGTVTVSRQGEAFRVVWLTGGDPVEGIGVVVNDVLAVAYGGAGAPGACGVVAYNTAGDDGFEAVWATMGGTALGTEAARPEPAPAQAGGDVYRVTGTNPGSGTLYSGTLAMAETDGGTLVRWSVGGRDYDGLGLSVDDVLGIAYGDQTCGVAVYRIDGDALDGVWTTPGAAGVGTEVARP